MAGSLSDYSATTFFVLSSGQDPSYDPPRRRNRHRRGGRRSRGRRSVSSQTVHLAMGFCIQSIIGLLQTRGQSINYPINITAALIALCIYSAALAAEIVLQREPPRRTHMAISCHVSLISGALAAIALASTFLPSPLISCVTMFVVWAFVVVVTAWPLIRSLKQCLFRRTMDAVVLVLDMFGRFMGRREIRNYQDLPR